MPSSDIVANLKKFMHHRRITSRELAKRSQVKPSFIYDILNGKSANPSSIKLARVAQSLGVSLSQLVEPGDTPSVSTESPSTLPHIRNIEGGFIFPDYIDITQTAKGMITIRKTPKDHVIGYAQRWFARQFGTDGQNIVQAKISGDSMHPTLQHNDTILIDTSQTIPSPPGLFVLFDGMGLIAKRIEYVKKETGDYVRITSDNSLYGHHEKPLDDIEIIGRIVWFSRQL